MTSQSPPERSRGQPINTPPSPPRRLDRGERRRTIKRGGTGRPPLTRCDRGMSSQGDSRVPAVPLWLELGLTRGPGTVLTLPRIRPHASVELQIHGCSDGPHPPPDWRADRSVRPPGSHGPFEPSGHGGWRRIALPTCCLCAADHADQVRGRPADHGSAATAQPLRSCP